MQMVLGYAWPGNVRELQNVIERAAIFADGTIDEAHLPEALIGKISPRGGGNKKGVDKPLDERLMEIEKEMIIEAINQAGGVQARAAHLLGINPRSLWHRVQKTPRSMFHYSKSYKICRVCGKFWRGGLVGGLGQTQTGHALRGTLLETFNDQYIRFTLRLYENLLTSPPLVIKA